MFIEDCCRYRALIGNVSRGVLCKTMIDTYGGSTAPAAADLLDSHLDRVLGKDYDAEEVSSFSAETAGKGTNILGLGGPLWDEVTKSIEEGKHPDDLWDKLDAVVFDGVIKSVGKEWKDHVTYKKLCQFLYIQDAPVDEDDFGLFRVLGRGGFGLVNGCKRCTSGKVRLFACFGPSIRQLCAPAIGLLTTHTSFTAIVVFTKLYAMKVQNKKRVKVKRSQQLCLNEREALAAVNSPFVVNLKYAFVSKNDLFLILDLMTGGDLSFHLMQKGKFSKAESQYYAARIMLGCQALHDRKYVYRDLKPENILMGDDGRVCITDLGLACKVTPKLHGAAGTRGYWAPDMLRRDKNGKKYPYGHAVDWFSFGCMLAEFICGVCPFRSEAALKFGQDAGHKAQEKAIDEATLKMDPEFDSGDFDADSIDLCTKLLKKEPKKRLGYNGCKDIMDHPWFKEVDWQMIISDREVPPYIPPKDVNAASQSEIGVFEDDDKMKVAVLEEKDHAVYKDWTWTNPKSFHTEVIEFLMYEKSQGGEMAIGSADDGGGCCLVS